MIGVNKLLRVPNDTVVFGFTVMELLVCAIMSVVGDHASESVAFNPLIVMVVDSSSQIVTLPEPVAVGSGVTTSTIESSGDKPQQSVSRESVTLKIPGVLN